MHDERDLQGRYGKPGCDAREKFYIQIIQSSEQANASLDIGLDEDWDTNQIKKEVEYVAK